MSFTVWKRAFAALSLIALSVTGAHAGGGSLKGGPSQPSTWTGAYVGIVAGRAWGESRFDDGLTSNPFDIDGHTIGGTAGYNLHIQRGLVAGIEADLSYSSISGKFGPGNLGQPNGNSWDCYTGACVTDVNWFGTLRGRLGFAADRFLVYATGGLALGGVDSKIRNDADWVTGGINLGWTAGGGIEVAFAPGWSAKIEYLHVDLGWTQRNSTYAQLKSDAEIDIVRLGVNYHIGTGN
jgi:outer membrane immunogenic protein